MRRLEVIILAAGQGTRMRSDLPKVLHPIAGRPLLRHVYETARALAPQRIHVVYGHGGARVQAQLADLEVRWVEQAQQLGTGHAVAQAMDGVAEESTLLVLYGDVPLIASTTLERLVAAAEAGIALLTVELADPTGYGRILRDGQGQVARIVEQKDAQGAELAIREVNTGLLAIPASRLRSYLARLDNANAQGEFYLTDIFAMAAAEGVAIATTAPAETAEVLGINDRVQLAEVERHYQQRQAAALLRQGLTLCDPQRFDLRGELTVGRDCTIDVNVVLEGRVVLGDGVTIGAHCVIKDAEIGSGSQIQPFCHIEQARIGPAARIGPYARIRPESEIGEAAHIGNFVEVKKSTIGHGSKVNHLAYIGDTSMGQRVNIGAGTITCNYDGANKHRTTIGDDVFIGSDTQLVAPVTVHSGATIGAGSTITKDAPADELTLSRSKQLTFPGWKRPVKGRP